MFEMLNHTEAHELAVRLGRGADAFDRAAEAIDPDAGYPQRLRYASFISAACEAHSWSALAYTRSYQSLMSI